MTTMIVHENGPNHMPSLCENCHPNINFRINRSHHTSTSTSTSHLINFQEIYRSKYLPHMVQGGGIGHGSGVRCDDSIAVPRRSKK